MKSNITKNLMLVSLSFGVSITSYAQTSSRPSPDKAYRVRIPVRQLSCAEEASKLAEAFKAATGITPSSSSCTGTASVQGQNHSIYSLTLLYPRVQVLNHVKTKFGYLESSILGGANDSGDYYGIYKNYQSCLSALENKVEEFERYTELNAVSAYCSKALVRDGYVLTIESFGKPKQNLYTFDSSIGLKADSTLKLEVIKHLQHKGATVVETVGSRFFYYSPKATDLRQRRLLSYQSEEACTRQLDEGRKIVNGFDRTSNIARCVQATGPAMKKDFHLVGILSSSNYLVSSTSPEGFVSLDECLSQTERVISEQTYSTGKASFGALCTFDSLNLKPEKYKMDIFSSL